jgi:Fic family protein
MERGEFTDLMPGALVDIPGGCAFVPDPLPPLLTVDVSLLQLVEAARGLLGELIGQARLIHNLELATAPLARREAVLSSRIEGTHTEIRDVLRYEAAGRSVSPDPDLREVLNYLDAERTGYQWLSEQRPFNLALVRGLHEVLMSGARGQDKHPGSFRTEQVFIGNRANGMSAARFVPPPPARVLPLMDDIARFVQAAPTYTALIDAALLHYQFETVHPFTDGNGRIGRLLISLSLFVWKAVDRPILYMSPYLESRRDEYMSRLKRVSTHGEWDEWVRFFIDGVRHQSEDSLRRLKRVMEIQAQYREIARLIPNRAALPAIDLVMERVYVTPSEVARFTHTTYPTARAALEALTTAGVLTQQAEGRHRTWVAEQLLRDIYEG